MLIYNVTVKIDHARHDEWISWMTEQHIPDVMATGKFIEYRLTRVMMEDPEGTNYSIQYLCKDKATLAAYEADHAPALQAEHRSKFENHFVAFRTLLEMVDHNSKL